MKKILFTIVFAAFGLAAAAQDTVRYPDPWYGYSYREALWEYTGPDTTLYVVPYDNDHTTTWGEPIRSFISTWSRWNDHSLHGRCDIITPVAQEIDTIYGVAITIDRVAFDSIPGEIVVYSNGRLFNRVGHPWYDNGYPAVQHLNFDFDSIYSFPPNNPPLVKQCTFEYDYSLPTQWSLYSNCYEFYFDEPIVVSKGDTAYIGVSPDFLAKCFDKVHIGRDTSRSQWWYQTFIATDTSLIWPCVDIFHNINRWIGYLVDDSIHYSLYYSFDSMRNAYWNDCYWGGIFPIVQLRCTAPRGLQMAQGDKRDTAVWRGDNDADLFQLSFCPDSLTIPDSGSLVTLDSTRFPLPNLPHPDTSYVVYLRKMCTFAFNTGHTDTVWSAWSVPLLIDSTTAGDHYGLEGIADIESSKLTVDITPNPASGMVEVRCSEPMALLELFNAAGDKVFSQSLSTFNFQFSIFNFPSGTYLVRITTPQGVTTRKLVKR